MVTVISNQNLFDIALQECGVATAAFAIALVNDMEVTDSLQPGQVLELPKIAPEDPDVVRYFKRRGVKVATDGAFLSGPANGPGQDGFFLGLPGMLPMMLS